jgi:hypothetical protein
MTVLLFEFPPLTCIFDQKLPVHPVQAPRLWVSDIYVR